MIPYRPAVESLGDHHDRSTFSCGKAALDRYLRRQAGQDVRRRLAAVFVVCEPGSAVVSAYFTLSALSIPVTKVSESMRRRIPYPEVPAVLVGRLAVDARHTGRGVGGFLLMEAAQRCLTVEEPAVWAMVVDPIDEEAASFYQHYGFVPFASRPDRLFLPLATLRAALHDRRRPRSG